MPLYKYCDLEGTHVVSDEEIIEEYWEYWSDKMKSAKKDPALITKENCIYDFCVIHWAYLI